MSVAHSLQISRTKDVIISENVDFESLLLSRHVLDGLRNAGFQQPSPIQLKAIPLARCGLDLIVQAKSGTGKTCIFSVVALENIDVKGTATQVLILAPTREIAVQIWEVIKCMGSSIDGLCCHMFIGGMPVHEDIKKLKCCHVAVGTPGRIQSLIDERSLKTESIRLFVLDEADKLLEESFQKQINWIYSALPENKQILALSATYPEYLAQHLTIYMRNPTFVRLNIYDPVLLGIKQYYMGVKSHLLQHKVFAAKMEAVVQLLSSVSFHQCLIFSNLQTRAQNMEKELTSLGWPAACIAGCLGQKERNAAMSKLKMYECRILISTDLTSRGIDAHRVDLIINLDVPQSNETYLHRIGRAGRFGSYGAAVSIVCPGQETLDLQRIELSISASILPLPEPIPTNLTKQVCQINLDDVVSTEQLITRCSVNCSEGREHPPPHSINSSNCGKTEPLSCPSKDVSMATISNGCHNGDIVSLFPIATEKYVKCGSMATFGIVDSQSDMSVLQGNKCVPYDEDYLFAPSEPVCLPLRLPTDNNTNENNSVDITRMEAIGPAHGLCSSADRCDIDQHGISTNRDNHHKSSAQQADDKCSVLFNSDALNRTEPLTVFHKENSSKFNSADYSGEKIDSDTFEDRKLAENGQLNWHAEDAQLMNHNAGECAEKFLNARSSGDVWSNILIAQQSAETSSGYVKSLSSTEHNLQPEFRMKRNARRNRNRNELDNPGKRKDSENRAMDTSFEHELEMYIKVRSKHTESSKDKDDVDIIVPSAVEKERCENVLEGEQPVPGNDHIISPICSPAVIAAELFVVENVASTAVCTNRTISPSSLNGCDESNIALSSSIPPVHADSLLKPGTVSAPACFARTVLESGVVGGKNCSRPENEISGLEIWNDESSNSIAEAVDAGNVNCSAPTSPDHVLTDGMPEPFSYNSLLQSFQSYSHKCHRSTDQVIVDLVKNVAKPEPVDKLALKKINTWLECFHHDIRMKVQTPLVKQDAKMIEGDTENLSLTKTDFSMKSNGYESKTGSEVLEHSFQTNQYDSKDNLRGAVSNGRNVGHFAESNVLLGDHELKLPCSDNHQTIQLDYERKIVDESSTTDPPSMNDNLNAFQQCFSNVIDDGIMTENRIAPSNSQSSLHDVKHLSEELSDSKEDNEDQIMSTNSGLCELKSSVGRPYPRSSKDCLDDFGHHVGAEDNRKPPICGQPCEGILDASISNKENVFMDPDKTRRTLNRMRMTVCGMSTETEFGFMRAVHNPMNVLRTDPGGLRGPVAMVHAIYGEMERQPEPRAGDALLRPLDQRRANDEGNRHVATPCNEDDASDDYGDNVSLEDEKDVESICQASPCNVDKDYDVLTLTLSTSQEDNSQGSQLEREKTPCFKNSYADKSSKRKKSFDFRPTTATTSRLPLSFSYHTGMATPGMAKGVKAHVKPSEVIPRSSVVEQNQHGASHGGRPCAPSDIRSSYPLSAFLSANRSGSVSADYQYNSRIAHCQCCLHGICQSQRCDRLHSSCRQPHFCAFANGEICEQCPEQPAVCDHCQNACRPPCCIHAIPWCTCLKQPSSKSHSFRCSQYLGCCADEHEVRKIGRPSYCKQCTPTQTVEIKHFTRPFFQEYHVPHAHHNGRFKYNPLSGVYQHCPMNTAEIQRSSLRSAQQSRSWMHFANMEHYISSMAKFYSRLLEQRTPT